MSLNQVDIYKKKTKADWAIGCLMQSGSLSLLTNYCQSRYIATPVWSEEATRVSIGVFSFTVTMVIQGLKFQVCNVSSKSEGRKAVAQAAVEHFTNEEVPFFQTARHPGYIPLLNNLCQAVGYSTPLFDTIPAVSVGGFMMAVDVNDQTYESPTPSHSKQQGKEKAAKVAFESMVDSSFVIYMLQSKFASSQFSNLVDSVTITPMTTRVATRTPSATVSTHPVSLAIEEDELLEIDYTNALSVFLARDPTRGVPIYNHRSASDPVDGESTHSSQLIIKGRVFLSKLTHYSQADAANEVAHTALKMLYPEENSRLFSVYMLSSEKKTLARPTAITEVSDDLDSLLESGDAQYGTGSDGEVDERAPPLFCPAVAALKLSRSISISSTGESEPTSHISPDSEGLMTANAAKHPRYNLRKRKLGTKAASSTETEKDYISDDGSPENERLPTYTQLLRSLLLEHKGYDAAFTYLPVDKGSVCQGKLFLDETEVFTAVCMRPHSRSENAKEDVSRDLYVWAKNNI
ncbi:hypothetical protein BASA83_010684 [Batrachochytrium salamandrivorans]|nr:hypothetical protein BASA62_008052 [Batrachochytrium salamandrivorans]KAH9266300.1 hypothetical protein BASA83_010684 [Batrachochytrium salamandrivorans]